MSLTQEIWSDERVVEVRIRRIGDVYFGCLSIDDAAPDWEFEVAAHTVRGVERAMLEWLEANP